MNRISSTINGVLERLLLRAYDASRPTPATDDKHFRAIYKESYEKLLEFRRRKNILTDYAHPEWQSFESSIAALNDNLQPDFLRSPVVRATFFRIMAFEFPRHRYRAILTALNNAAHVLNYAKSANCDEDIGGLVRDCRQYNISSNSAELLCQIDSIQENGILQNKIVEFGGGFGAAARHFIGLHAPQSYVVIDLNEVLHLTYLYLRMTIKDRPILWLNSLDPASIELIKNTGPAVVLLPREVVFTNDEVLRHLCQDAMFYASFSLSECNDETIDAVGRQIFPHCKSAAIYGQTFKNAFHTEDLILRNIQNTFSRVSKNPYFYGKAYALYARK